MPGDCRRRRPEGDRAANRETADLNPPLTVDHGRTEAVKNVEAHYARMSRPLSPGSPVTLSVVIPCFNEERTLARCLERLLEIADDETRRSRSIVVDDCSTDGTARAAQGELAPLMRRLHRATTVNQGKGAALRDAASRA